MMADATAQKLIQDSFTIQEERIKWAGRRDLRCVQAN